MTPLAKRSVRVCFQTTLALALAARVVAGEAVQLGSQRELFVDHFLIETMDGVELRLHEPQREGIAVKFDRP